MMATLILALGMLAGGQAQPPVQAQDLNALVERVVRATELQRQKLDLERRMAALAVGENHPEMLNLKAEMAFVEAAIRRYEFESYRSELEQVAEARAALRLQVAEVGRRLGPEHPSRRSLETQLASMRERERLLAVRQLASGTEADLLAATDRDPADPAPLIQLGGLYATAGRNADAERVLSRAIAVLRGGLPE